MHASFLDLLVPVVQQERVSLGQRVLLYFCAQLQHDRRPACDPLISHGPFSLHRKTRSFVDSLHVLKKRAEYLHSGTRSFLSLTEIHTHNNRCHLCAECRPSGLECHKISCQWIRPLVIHTVFPLSQAFRRSRRPQCGDLRKGVPSDCQFSLQVRLSHSATKEVKFCGCLL